MELEKKIKGGTGIRTSIYFDKELFKRLQEACKEQRRSRSNLISQVLEKYLHVEGKA